LMASLDDAILSVSPDLKIKFFNARMAHQFLERAQTDLLQQMEPVPLAQIMREPEILKLYQMTLQTGETQMQSLRLHSLMHQQNRYFSVKVSPLREEKDSKIYGAMGLFHDVTELKKADQIRIEFVENASHELRTPLTSIKGFVETAKEDLTAGRTEQLGSFLGIISKNVDRLTELVNDMLTLTTLDADTAFKRELIQPQQVTEEIVERLSPLANEKSLVIRMSFEASPFPGDLVKVEQVLENLVSNAIKYIPNQRKIEIRWDEDSRFVRLHVIDDGPGIADIHLGRLFERFYRVDKGRSRDVGGTGLGLSIVKHVMQSHGGTVQVKSEIGRGSEFICSFPK
jgi:two-component system phosphate regulon sensor histidine kinase PhoR